jgi:hypothetical protein
MVWTILFLGVTAAAFVLVGAWGMLSILTTECLESDADSGDSQLED